MTYSNPSTAYVLIYQKPVFRQKSRNSLFVLIMLLLTLNEQEEKVIDKIMSAPDTKNP